MSNLLQTLKTADNFSMLVGALETTGLDQTLSSGEPYTLFAPEDDAFNDLPKEVLNKLMKDEQRLGNVLKYHVLAGTYKAADIGTISRATTLEGDDLEFRTEVGGLRVDEAVVTESDLAADNSIIHTIDKVILPEKYLY